MSAANSREPMSHLEQIQDWFRMGSGINEIDRQVERRYAALQRSMPSAELGELCRRIMLLYNRFGAGKMFPVKEKGELGRQEANKFYRRGDVFKWRALAKFTSSGSVLGITSLFIPEATKMMASEGGSPELAFRLLDEMLPMLNGVEQATPDTPGLTKALVTLFFFKKRGFILYREERYEEALAVFQRAPELDSASSDSLDIQGGAVMCRYAGAFLKSDEAGRLCEQEKMREIARLAQENKFASEETKAIENVRLMGMRAHPRELLWFDTA